MNKSQEFEKIEQAIYLLTEFVKFVRHFPNLPEFNYIALVHALTGRGEDTDITVYKLIVSENLCNIVV